MSPQDGYDAPLSALRNHVEDLAADLAIWQARDDGKPDAHARRAANDAVDAIDAAIKELHQIRARLITEVRVSDDATAARVDAMLARTARDQAFPAASRPEEHRWPGARTPGPRKVHDENPH